MRTRLLSATKDVVKAFEDWCAKAEDIRVVTAWATTDCVACDCLAKARSKISTMVVGLDLYTTSPSFLKSFRSIIRIGTAIKSATFHPKLYLFQDGNAFCCIMGSSNFTRGGFGDNTEVNVCVEGAKADPLLAALAMPGTIVFSGHPAGVTVVRVLDPSGAPYADAVLLVNPGQVARSVALVTDQSGTAILPRLWCKVCVVTAIDPR